MWLFQNHFMIQWQEHASLYGNPWHANINTNDIKEDVVGGGQKEEKRELLSKGPDRRGLARGCQTGKLQSPKLGQLGALCQCPLHMSEL